MSAIVFAGTVTASFTIPTGTFTDRSGNIAAGGTSQQLAAANASRKQLIVFNPADAAGQNITSVEPLYINFTSAAADSGTTSLELLPGEEFNSGSGPVSTEAVNVVAATTGHVYIAKEM